MTETMSAEEEAEIRTSAARTKEHGPDGDCNCYFYYDAVQSLLDTLDATREQLRDSIAERKKTKLSKQSKIHQFFEILRNRRL